MIDKTKLNAAFRQMRFAGLVARQNFSCCGNCAGYELATDVTKMPGTKRAKVKGCCFYHRQDTARMEAGYDLFLRFGPLETQGHGTVGLSAVQVGQLVTLILAQAGLTYEWDGTASQCIVVKA